MIIIITAGGTSEPIDAVRSITNTSTGRLACEIHDIWVAYANKHSLDLTIHYVMTNSAIMPRISPYTHIHTVTDTFSVKSKLKNLLTTEKVYLMIHPMAVSDYYVHNVQTTDIFANNLYTYIQTHIKSLSVTLINNFLKNTPTTTHLKSKKIASSESLYIQLKQTPKLIKMVKEISPNTKLVGFKLLSNVSEIDLINAANKQYLSSGSDFVIANDSTKITPDQHPALLIKKDKIITRCTTKKEIAQAILQEVLK